MKAVPSFESYGEYASGNYGVNAMRFSLPNGITFYYSYSTLVAYRSPVSDLVIRKNDWSTTTGKHLNWIDGGSAEAKKRRLSESEFETKLDRMLEHYGLGEEERCRVCGAEMYARMRAHHHHRSDCKELHDCATTSDCKGEGQ